MSNSASGAKIGQNTFAMSTYQRAKHATPKLAASGIESHRRPSKDCLIASHFGTRQGFGVSVVNSAIYAIGTDASGSAFATVDVCKP